VTTGPLPPAPRYPRIDDYGFLGDGLGAALVSTAGSIDWACLRRIDTGSTFGRLLDWDAAGYFRIAPLSDAATVTRRYVEDTMVLETTFWTPDGVARLLDLLALTTEGVPIASLVRIVEGVSGAVTFGVELRARYDYGRLRPWVRTHTDCVHSLLGGDDGLLINTDMPLEVEDDADMCGTVTVRAGERRRIALDVRWPHEIDPPTDIPPSAAQLDQRLEDTIVGWRRIREDVSIGPSLRRSALVLRALGNADTGAIAAAATTSLPEVVGGDSNWDYRYTWIRDSWLTVRSLAEVGDIDCADRFRRFVERSAAGQVAELQIVFGVGGEHDLFERELDHLEGWRGSGPVRIGNAAAGQLQLDAFGELLELAWLWHERGFQPDDDWWRFLVDVADHTAERWREPDHGIWEIRGDRRHFVHSKAFAWVALDRATRLAEELGRDGDVARWRTEADHCHEETLRRGTTAEGWIADAYDSEVLDAAVLLLPSVGFVHWTDPRMVATVDAVIDRLVDDGLVRRREGWDDEGAFLPCSFWLVECLAHQGRVDEAKAFFDRVTSLANDVGLFAEEHDTRTGQPLGNYPQALTHLSHITAAVALRDASR
jgi:GH15 family glucan-1,4-alpha-glucosidase